MQRSTTKALIFDVDGTLAETEELHRKAFNETFAHYGLNWHWDKSLYGELLKVAGGKNRLTHFIENWQPDCAGDFIDQVARMHARKTQCYGDLLARGELTFRPGMAALIKEALETEVKLAIVTSTSRKNVDALFDATLGANILHKFSAVCCGDEVSKVKPDPEIYFLALDKLALSGAECLAFEDSQIGLAASRAANIPTIITYSSYTAGEDFSGAEIVMEDLINGKFELSSCL